MTDAEFHIRVFPKALPTIRIRCNSLIKRWGHAIAILLRQTVCSHAHVVASDDDTMIVTLRLKTDAPNTTAIKSIVQTMTREGDTVDVSMFEWHPDGIDESWRDVDWYALIQLYDACEACCLSPTRPPAHSVKIMWDSSMPATFPCLGIPGYWISSQHSTSSFEFNTADYYPADMTIAREFRPMSLAKAESVLATNDFGYPVVLWCADQMWIDLLSDLLRKTFEVRTECISVCGRRENAIECRMGPSKLRSRDQGCMGSDALSIGLRQIMVRAFRVVDVSLNKPALTHARS